MAGFTSDELATVHKWARTVPLRETSTSTLSVMHPMHCLQAQLENIYGTLNRRRLAIEACRRLSANNAVAGDPETAMAIAEHVHKLSLLPSALRARREDGLCLEDGIYSGSEMPPAFLQSRIPQMQRLLNRKVKKYEELQLRKQARAGRRFS